jgi:hypothetical protein
MLTTETLFQDEIVTATELNRHAGQILEKALLKPLTIMRNDEAFALVRRSTAAHWVEAARHAETLVDLYSIVVALGGGEIAVEDPYRWVSAFDRDQFLEMTSELKRAFRGASVGGNWDQFVAVLHEWEESGWAALSTELEEALGSKSEEVTLTVPPG